MENKFHATTIVAVRKNGKVAIAGDGQVTFGQSTIMKATARKIRKLHHGKIWPALPDLWQMPFP